MNNKTLALVAFGFVIIVFLLFPTNTFALTKDDIGLNILSPGPILASGEKVYLNFTTLVSVSGNYSLNDGIKKNLENGTSFSELLYGDLLYGVLKNGEHNIKINIWKNSSLFVYNYSFNILDNSPPKINIKLNSSLVNKTSLKGIENSYIFSLECDEFCNVSYSLNNKSMGKIYLGNKKKINFSLDLDEGVNELKIKATDFQGNDADYIYIFNFSYSPTCTDGIQNGDETGIDCGGSCPECINFEISTNKIIYDYEEAVWLTILSRPNSFVNFTVYYMGDIIQKRHISSYSPNYPIFLTTVLDNLTYSGEYRINATSDYMGNIEKKTIIFHINEPKKKLSVSINTNASTINEGESIKFWASVSESIGKLDYAWDFDNDGSIDSNSIETIKKYNSNGTFVVNLTVTDDIGKASDIKTIIVKKIFNITITVKNITNHPISGARVRLNNIEKETSSNGIVKFLLNPGEYRLIVRKEGYTDFTNTTFKVKDNVNVNLSLLIDAEDKEKPNITIISPENDEKIKDRSVDIMYQVRDKSEVNCSIELLEDGIWVNKENQKNVSREYANSFILEDLDDALYRFRIKCVDEHGNSEYSPSIRFYIEYSDEQELEDKISYITENSEEFIEKIDEILDKFEKLPMLEKEAYELLNLRKKLDNAKTLFLRYRRDLTNLVWRRLNETEEKKVENEIRQKMRDLEDEVPINIRVHDSKEFVDYPREEDIRKVTENYLDREYEGVSGRARENLIKKLIELQSLVTITTNVKIVEIEYLSGKEEKITLIEKRLRFSGLSEELALVEYIPRDIISSLNDVEFLFNHEVIDDNLIEIELVGVDSFVYYIKKEVLPDSIKRTKSVLIGESSQIKGNQITGYSIFDRLGPNFDMSTSGRIIIQIFIIIILAGIYVGYSVKGSKIKYYFKDKNSLIKLRKINDHVAEAENKLFNNNYEEAKEIYKKTHPLFLELPKDIRKEAHKNIMVLTNKLDSHYINKLIDKANYSIDGGDKKMALSIYNQICGTYSRISPEYKSSVLNRCNQLRERISKNAK